MKTFEVIWAENENDWVKHFIVKARNRKAAEKEARKEYGADILIDLIEETSDYNYSRYLAEQNID